MSELSDDALLSDVATLVGCQRKLTARLVARLAEIEERRLHLLTGFSSMFDFCQQKLGMSEGEAFRRILAARLCRRFPSIYPLLASGRVQLSTLELIRERLTDENHEELIEAVAGKSKREVQGYLAARFPRPDIASRIRRLSTVEPLSEARFKVEFTATKALCDKLEQCRDLMSHVNPHRDLDVVIERAVDLLLRDLERRRCGLVKRPRREPETRFEHVESSKQAGGDKTGSAHVESSLSGKADCGTRQTRVPTAARREVFQRDGLQCTYVSEDGHRCKASAFLELDHIEPRAMGGSNDAANLRVRCRAHNQLWAEQVFGREQTKRMRLRQKKNAPGASEERTRAQESGTSLTLEKVRLALRAMGFREGQARRAVAEVAGKHPSDWSLDMERALREALIAAMAA